MVWLSGEQDLATAGRLSAALHDAMDGGDCDVVVDMRAVRFIDASVVGVLVSGRTLLEANGRRLTLRFPQRSPMKVLVICGLEDFIDAASAPGTHPQSALESWVAVPPAPRLVPASPTPTSPQDERVAHESAFAPAPTPQGLPTCSDEATPGLAEKEWR